MCVLGAEFGIAQSVSESGLAPSVMASDSLQVTAPAEVPAEENGARAFYDDGFVLAADDVPGPDGESLSYRLKISGWGQLRITNFHSTGPNNDLNQLQLKRARLVFSGHAFTPDFSYFVQLDGRSTSGDDVRLLDYFLSFDLGHHWWGAEHKFLVLKTGKYRVPSTLARYFSGREFQFTDNSVASTFFDVNRSLAIGLYGERQLVGRPLSWETAIFNGLVTGGAETGSAGALDNNFAYSGRLMFYPTGDWGESDLADYEFHLEPATRVGLAFACSRINEEGTSEYDTIRVVDSGQLLSTLLPLEAEEYLVCLYAVDGSIKYRGLSFAAEYYFRNISNFVGIRQTDLFDHGFWLQSGYFVVPQKLELLARWSRVVGNSGTLGALQQSSDEVAFGLCWYLRHNQAKFTIDGTWLNSAPIDSPQLDIRPGDQGFMARTQIQFSF